MQVGFGSLELAVKIYTKLDARWEVVLGRQTELGLELEICFGREQGEELDVLDFYIWNELIYL